jgi:hypothetical protein
MKLKMMSGLRNRQRCPDLDPDGDLRGHAPLVRNLQTISDQERFGSDKIINESNRKFVLETLPDLKSDSLSLSL